jgi:hypothetical protein
MPAHHKTSCLVFVMLLVAVGLALPWHRGQCRLPHELNEMATWPQSEQRSR